MDASDFQETCGEEIMKLKFLALHLSEQKLYLDDVSCDKERCHSA